MTASRGIVPSPWLARWALVFVVCTASLGLFGLTGSSGAFGSREDLLLTAEEARAVHEVVGRSRWIRSDEFAIEQPAHRAQQLAAPSYPAVNLGLGLGQIQRNPFSLPVADWGLIFSPFSWPLLLGSRWAHGLRWFFRAAVLALGYLAWISLLAWRRGDTLREAKTAGHVAGIGALAIYFSSASQWLFNHALFDQIACAGLAAFSYQRSFAAERRAARWGWLGFGAWIGTCGFFRFYAPGWAPALWLLCAASIDAAIKSTRDVRQVIRRALTGLALTAAGASIALLYHAPYVEVIRSSLFPGRRVAVAGELGWQRLLDLAWPSLHESAPLTRDPGYFGTNPFLNVCETSAVEAIPFLFVLAIAVVSPSARRALLGTLRRAPATAAAWAVLGTWCFARVPDWVRDLALLRWSPGSRTFWYFGAATAALSAVLVSELVREARRNEDGSVPAIAEGVIAVVFVVGMWLLARGELAGGGRTGKGPIAVTAALLVLSGFLWRRPSAPWVLSLAWLAPLVVATAPVNPIARTSTLFREGAGHEVVERALRDRPGRIVDYDTHWAALLVPFGWPVLNSVNFTPDVDLYRFLEPDAPGVDERVYNRYGRAQFAMPPAPLSAGFDAFRIPLSPCSARLATLGVNHFLTGAPASFPDACAAEFETRPAGRLLLWSRLHPVGLVGAARSETSSALEFDWSADGEGRLVGLKPGRAALEVDLPAKPGSIFAIAVNLSLVDEVLCKGATSRAIDTHLVFHVQRPAARCTVRFLMTAGAIRRALRPGAPRIVFRSAGDDAS